jgi:excisionase family DNA binding protein
MLTEFERSIRKLQTMAGHSQEEFDKISNDLLAMGQAQIDEPLYTRKEAQDYLKVSRSTLNRLLREGILKGFKVGTQWRFTREQLKGCVK